MAENVERQMRSAMIVNFTLLISFLMEAQSTIMYTCGKQIMCSEVSTLFENVFVFLLRANHRKILRTLSY